MEGVWGVLFNLAMGALLIGGLYLLIAKPPWLPALEARISQATTVLACVAGALLLVWLAARFVSEKVAQHGWQDVALAVLACVIALGAAFLVLKHFWHWIVSLLLLGAWGLGSLFAWESVRHTLSVPLAALTLGDLLGMLGVCVLWAIGSLVAWAIGISAHDAMEKSKAPSGTHST
jgi:hypothetical protein